MPRLIRPGWLVLGLMLFAAGCSAPGAGLRAATATPELSTATQVAQMEDPTPIITPEGSLAGGTISAVTPTARPMAETPDPEGVTVPTPAETPPVSVVGPSAEAEVAPLETPTLAAMAEGEGESPGVDETGHDRGPTEGQLELLASLESYGPGPELHSDVWLNSEPLDLVDLRGKVVMVEFWTFG